MASTVEQHAGEPHRIGAWQRAHRRALDTPETRNRCVDFLRAASIGVVVAGHWIMAAPTVETGVGFTLSDILRVAPWTQWLTWIFQVMPIFFAVGGFANAASWEAARASGTTYDAWISRRLQRLVRPLVPFLLVWCGLGLAARWSGIGRALVESGSEAAFMPTWFLAVYVLVIVLAPPMHAMWRRLGMTSFWMLVIGAASIDALARLPGLGAIEWANYIFVWLAIHQLGFAWRDGVLSSPLRAVPFALAGLATLIVLEGLASYPVSMVTVPGETAANSNPPTTALLALGVTHVGLVLTLERHMQRGLQRSGLWTATVFGNGVVMTLYLWHATVMVLLVGAAELVGGFGLHSVPSSLGWWAWRPAWLGILLLGLGLFVATFGRFEMAPPAAESPPPAWRSVVGALALCVGLVALTAGGIWGDNPLGVRVWPVLLSLAGSWLVAAGRAGARGRSALPRLR